MTLAGKTICFTGTLSMKRADATKAAEAAGAKVGGSVTGKTDILVAGPGAGAKEDQARAKGVEVWSEANFAAAIGGGGGGGGSSSAKPAAKGKGKAEEEREEPAPAKRQKVEPEGKGKADAESAPSTLATPSAPIEWSWETMVTEFKSGNDLSDVQKDNLVASYNQAQGCVAITLEDVQAWRIGDSRFAAQDLTLYTYTNVCTRDIVRVWKYGLGDNDYGTLQFLLADGTAFMFAVIADYNLYFKDVESELPESVSEDTRTVFAGVLKWYNAIEDDYDELAKEVLGRDVRVQAPSCDPDAWKEMYHLKTGERWPDSDEDEDEDDDEDDDDDDDDEEEEEVEEV